MLAGEDRKTLHDEREKARPDIKGYSVRYSLSETSGKVTGSETAGKITSNPMAGTTRDNQKLVFSGYTIPIRVKEVLDIDGGDG